MSLTLTIVHQTKKTNNKLYYRGMTPTESICQRLWDWEGVSEAISMKG